MQSMHLFAGAGGGLLADLILGHTPVVAVEWDAYCCQVLRERAAEGWFPGLRVHEGDVRLFDPSEYAGRVDCIHAGFPCQDISHTGNQAGVGEGTRSGLYREVLRIADVVRPRVLFLENVAAILGNGLGTVLGDLASRGYDTRWTCVSAAVVGAPHQRDRWWLLAHATRMQRDGGDDYSGDCMGREQVPKSGDGCWSDDVADSERCGQSGQGQSVDAICSTQGKDWQATWFEHGRGPEFWSTEPDVGRVDNELAPQLDGSQAIQKAEEVDDAKCDQETGAAGRQRCGDELQQVRFNGTTAPAPPRLHETARGGDHLREVPRQGSRDPTVGHSQQTEEVRLLRGDIHLQEGEGNDVQSVMRQYAGMAQSWWEVEPDVGRVAHGVPNRVDRLKALGNGQVPLQAALAWRILGGEIAP